MGRSPFRVGSILSETLTAEPTRAVALHVCRQGLQMRCLQVAPAQLAGLQRSNGCGPTWLPQGFWECAAVEQRAARVPPPAQDYSPTVRTIFPICSLDSM